MEHMLRKKRSELIISGVGAILLGSWAFVKIILEILFAADYVQRMFNFDSFDNPSIKPIMLFIWIMIGFISMLIYLYVGSCAIREGRTGKRHSCYIVLAALLLLANVLFLITNLMSFSESQAAVLDLTGELLQSFARALNFMLMLKAAGQTRKLYVNKRSEAVGYAD